MKNYPEHVCGKSLGIMCIHLNDGDDWWGVPAEDGDFDWMCCRCIDKFRVGDFPGPAEIRTVCRKCVREIQRHSRLHYPIATGNGSWRYDESPTLSHGAKAPRMKAEARKRLKRRRKLKERLGRLKNRSKSNALKSKSPCDHDPWQNERVAKGVARSDQVNITPEDHR